MRKAVSPVGWFRPNALGMHRLLCEANDQYIRLLSFVRGLAVFALLLPILLCAPGQRAAAQSMSDILHPIARSNDATYMRVLSRYEPRIAADLEAALKSAKSLEERNAVLQQYARRLREERDQYRNLPKEVRDANYGTYWTNSMSVINEMRGTGSGERRVKEYAEQIKFEDEVIKMVGFKDSAELYDYLKSLYPKDLGSRYMKELKTLKDHGRTEVYGDRLDLMRNILEAHRSETLPPSESVLPELSPYSPMIPAKPPQSGRAGPSGASPPARAEQSPCKTICNHPVMSTEARGWCQAHCRDELGPKP